MVHQRQQGQLCHERLVVVLLSSQSIELTAFIDTLYKSKVTGIEQVDTLQDSVNNAVGQQVGKGGILQPVGDMASSEGINRAERGGKDDQGSYGPLGSAGSAVSSGAGSAWSGAKSAGGAVGGELLIIVNLLIKRVC